MAHFAKLNQNNIVEDVIVISDKDIKDINGLENEERGKEICKRLFGGDWIQTSYNGKFRKRFAGIGYYYDKTLDAFIPPKPFNSFILNTETCLWEAPKPRPNDGKYYFWNEQANDWNEMQSPIIS